MAQNSADEEFQKSVECAVCFDVFNLDDRIPTAFQCLHTVCKVCIKNIPQGTSVSCPICKQDTEVGKLITNFGVVDIVEKLCQSCNSRMRAANCEHCGKQVCDVCLEKHAPDFYAEIKQKIEELRESVRRIAEMSINESIQNKEILKADETIDTIQKSMQFHMDPFIEGQKQLLMRVKQIRDTNIEQDIMWRKNITSRADIEGCKEFLRKSRDTLGTIYRTECTKEIMAKLNTEASDLLKQLHDLQTSIPRPTQYTFVTSQSPTTDIGRIVSPPSNSSRPSSTPDVGNVGISPSTSSRSWPTLGYFILFFFIFFLSSVFFTCSFYIKSSSTPAYNYERVPSTLMTGSEGSRPEQFADGGYVARMCDKYIVADTGNHGLKVYDSKLNLMFMLGAEGDKEHQFTYPMGLCTGRDGELFVSDANNHRINVYNKYLHLVRQFGSYGSGDNKFKGPCGLAVTSTGDLLVCDTDNHRVKVHKPDGSFIRSIGHEGARTVQFIEPPVSVAVTQDDNVLVVEEYATYLHVFRINGDYVRRITPIVPGSSEGIQLWGCTVDPDGNIIVTDVANHRLIVLDAEGKFVCTIGSRGVLPDEMDDPRSVALNTDNRQMIVYEAGNNRIQLFDV